MKDLLAIVLLMPAALSWAQRITIPLDGEWSVAEGVAPDAVPSAYPHRAPVPGMANLAVPALADVDRFDSLEILENKIRRKMLPASAAATNGMGVARQSRNYLWYRTTFRAPARRQTAILVVNKAQFGTAVWVNGASVGEHLGCFTAGRFNITAAMKWDAENVLLVRIGAHPGVLPPWAPSGTDQEKNFWSPGIYDSVSVKLADNPVIESVQVAPDILGPRIVVETRLRNYGPAGVFRLSHRVAGRSVAERVRLAAGEEKAVRATIPMPGAKLWSPEQPVLYTLESATSGDSASTRFGLREIRFDTATRRAMLNGRPYFMRGSNITLHRFFEDPLCKRLPWTEAWVRKLLIDIPKKLHWNSFRFCIGPVPDRWLDIADEAGLLIQNEFFVWRYRPAWDTKEMIRQYTEWVRDNANHPSVAIWDSNNETHNDTLADIIRAVRPLDLSNRAWENSYNPPVGIDDPVEDHPYLFSRLGKGFEIVDLEKSPGAKSTFNSPPSGHAIILNEYGWLWLNRDGSPTELTGDIYARLVGAAATPAERFAMNGYLLGGLTEYWRAHRNFAAVLHFVYLTSSYKGAFTSDHFRDVEKLELEPNFEDYMQHAFHPLGVYLNFWQPKLAGNAKRRIAVMLVNDEDKPAAGTLSLTLEKAGGAEAARATTRFEIGALGQMTYNLDLQVPAGAGACILKASAAQVVSRRKVVVP